MSVRGVPVTESAPLAGFIRRGVATLIDGLIVIVAWWLLAALLLAFEVPDGAVTGILLAVPLIYYPVSWSRHSEGQSFGKRALDIEVVDRDGRYISLWRAVGRYLAAVLSGLPLGLGFLWALWDRDNQTWHDKIARTWVRRVSYAPATPVRPHSQGVARAACPRCGESIATSARVCRYCSLELGEHWATAAPE